MLWLAEDYCVVAQSAASRNAESRLDFHVGLRGLQLGAHAEPDAQHSSDVVRPGRRVSERRSHASCGRSVAQKFTSEALETSGITQTNLEITRSARFFSGLLGLQVFWFFSGLVTLANPKYSELMQEVLTNTKLKLGQSYSGYTVERFDHIRILGLATPPTKCCASPH